jgi:nitroreductase
MKVELVKEPIKQTETINTIYERRAVRKYTERPVTKRLIEEVIDAGRMAPSAMNFQPWKFYVVTKKETIQLFSKEIRKLASKEFFKKAGLKQILKVATSLLHPSQIIDFFKEEEPVFHGAPVVIFITAPKENEWASLDIGMCSQNMMLAARSMGLDSCPIGFAKYLEHAKSYALLDIPSNEQLQLAIILGYGNETPEMHKRKKNNVTFIDLH